MVSNFKINIAYYLMKQFSKVAKARRRSIVITVLITPIILFLGIDISGLGYPVDGMRTDLDSYLFIKMIARAGNGFILIFKNSSQTIPLPNTTRTSIRNRSN